MKLKPRTCLFLFLSLSILGCGKKVQDDGTKPFQGTWTFFSNGKKTEKQATFEKDIVQVVAVRPVGVGGSVSLQQSSDSTGLERSTFRVDASQTPPRIDFVVMDGSKQGQTREGIFELTETSLKICVADYGAPRPTAFVAPERGALWMLQRDQ